MLDYTKEELLSMLERNPEKFNEWKQERDDVDLSEVDFSNMVLREVDFSDVDLNSSSFSDCSLTQVNFYGADLTSVDFTRSHVVECDFSESVLNGTDFSSENLASARYDSDTVWPDDDMMPDDFDTVCKDDLSALKDDEDNTVEDY